MFYSTCTVVLPKLSISVGANPCFDSFPLFFGNADRDAIRKQCPLLSQLHHGYSLKVIGSDGTVRSMEFFCNNSYVLSGNSKRTCQLDGTWSGRQPQCIKGICLFEILQYYESFNITKQEQSFSNGCVAACREPKISKLVRQNVSKPQLSSRYTHICFLLLLLLLFFCSTRQ